MNKLQLIPVVTAFTGLAFLGNTNKDKIIDPPKADSSVAAITAKSAALPLNTIKLPAGFSISVYAEVPGARSMVMSPSGTLYVGT
jgi:hypothetical protein